MVQDPVAVQRALNVFAFPPDTHGWFRMLVVSACVIGLKVGWLLAQRFHGGEDSAARETLSALTVQATSGRDLRSLTPQELADLGARIGPASRRALRDRVPRLCVVALIVLILAGGASAIYLDHPRRVRRRACSCRLTEHDGQTVVRYVEDWARAEELPPPALEYRDGFGNDAQVFGLRGRETLMFHGDPLLLNGAWGETLEIVTLHELGHVKNGDAQRREKSKAIWIALLTLLCGSAGWLVVVSGGPRGGPA